MLQLLYIMIIYICLIIYLLTIMCYYSLLSLQLLKKTNNNNITLTMLSAVCCKCTKSKCVKESCECYQQGITCNDDCACIDCKNTKADAADGRSPKKAAANTAAAASERMEVDTDDSGGRAEKTKKSPPSRSTNKTINYPSSRKPAALDASKLKKGEGCSCKNSK